MHVHMILFLPTVTFLVHAFCPKNSLSFRFGLLPTPTLLTTFDGRSSRPHGIITSFPMQLGGKTVCVEVEVVHAPLNYNLLSGRSWTYAMHAVVATIFWLMLSPHEG